jgi:hypothetical protein
MDAKSLRRLSAAQTVCEHGTPDLRIEFHCEHPFGLSMPVKDIKKA